jgi:hypothetical protein
MTSDMIQVHSFQKSLLKVFGRSVSHLWQFSANQLRYRFLHFLKKSSFLCRFYLFCYIFAAESIE